MCLVAVVSVVLIMRLYIQRSLQAKYKAGPDYLISAIKSQALEKGASGFEEVKSQYDPYYRESSLTETKEGEVTIGFPESSTEQTTTRAGWEKTSAASEAD